MGKAVENAGAPRLESVLLAFGLAFPFLILRLANVFHYDDMRIFVEWADCWKADARHVYGLCPSANYPLVGTFFSAGVIAGLREVFHLDDVEEIARYYRLVLACFDAANFVLLALIGRALGLRHAVALALAIELLPSTWAGGEVWGQIDTISQFFLLASLHGLMRAWQLAGAAQTRDRAKAQAHFLVGLCALALCALTKQLAIFSIVAMAPLAAAALWRLGAASKRALALGAVAVALAGALLLWLDRQADIPGYFGSSFLYVWFGGGSHHGRILTGNGFNIWVFLGRDMASSSDDPFLNLSLFGRAVSLTPRVAGFALYGLYALGAGALLARFCWRAAADAESSRRFLAGCLLLVALMNLGFNLFLTGTHERYLYHFYPFALLAAAVLAPRGARAATIGCYLSAGTLYGLFVLSIIQELPELLARLVRPEVLAGLHLAVLLSLAALVRRATVPTRPPWRLPPRAADIVMAPAGARSPASKNSL